MAEGEAERVHAGARLDGHVPLTISPVFRSIGGIPHVREDRPTQVNAEVARPVFGLLRKSQGFQCFRASCRMTLLSAQIVPVVWEITVRATFRAMYSRSVYCVQAPASLFHMAPREPQAAA